MGVSLFGWRNAVTTATLTDLSPTPAPAGLPVGQLQNDQGNPASGWQVPGLSASVLIDTANAAATWSAFLLARTNLTTAATLRWRVGSLPSLAFVPIVLPVTTAKFTLGSNVTSNGLTADHNGIAGNAWSFTLGASHDGTDAIALTTAVALAGGMTYRVGFWLRNVSGPIVGTGLILNLFSTDGLSPIINPQILNDGSVISSTNWTYCSVTFTTAASRTIGLSLFSFSGGETFAVESITIDVVNAFDTGTVAAAVQIGYGQSATVAPTASTGQACRLDVSDPTNPDGFLNVPLIYAGPVWQPQVAVSYASSMGRDDTTAEFVTRGGQEFPQFQFARRRWAVDLQGVRRAEVYSQLAELDRYSRTSGNVLFIPDYTSTDINRMAVLGRCKATADIGYPYSGGDARSWKANITERL